MRRGEEEGVGPAEERHTFRAYLHVAASMTGNLGKFSTEPAADGGGIKTKGESNKREKKKRENGERRGRWTSAERHRGPTCAEYLTRLQSGLRESKAANGLPDSNRRGGAGQAVWAAAAGQGRVEKRRKSSC